MLNLTVTHFFYADEIQFESLDVDAAEKEISMTNSNIVKSDKQDIIRLVVNSKNQDRQISHKFLLHEIVYTFVLEINFLSIFMLIEMRFCVIVNETNKFSKIQSLNDHDLTIINLILMNNFYFFNVV